MRSKWVINPELLNIHIHDSKHVLSFATLRNCWDPSNPLRSLIIICTCTSVDVIYCIHVHVNCILCKKSYIGKTGRQLDNRFQEHLRDIEKDEKNASKRVARHLNLSNHSEQHTCLAVCGHSLHQGSRESRKTLEQKINFQIDTLNPYGINERFSFNYRAPNQ